MNGNEALGLRPHRRGRALRRGLSDHAVVRHHGIAPPRAAEIRRHIYPDRGRDRRDLDGDWRQLRGRVAVTGSSGPGISLKTEALGWASMAEMPLVIVDVQRGGPSTGMPTNVEQSDLNIAIFGGHGDSARASCSRRASVEDCFYMAIEAVNIARKYSTPVIHPHRPGHRHAHRGVRGADLEKVCQDISPDFHAGGRPQALRPRGRKRTVSRASRARHADRRAASIRSSPASNTTNSVIRPVRRNCTRR